MPDTDRNATETDALLHQTNTAENETSPCSETTAAHDFAIVFTGSTAPPENRDGEGIILLDTVAGIIGKDLFSDYVSCPYTMPPECSEILYRMVRDSEMLNFAKEEPPAYEAYYDPPLPNYYYSLTVRLDGAVYELEYDERIFYAMTTAEEDLLAFHRYLWEMYINTEEYTTFPEAEFLPE